MYGSFKDSYSLIISEIQKVIYKVSEKEVNDFIGRIVKSKNIFLIGAGRMGIILQSFSMRLLHLGFNSYIVGSINCPPISSKDLLIVASSSGETSSVKLIAEMVKGYNADIMTITANPESTIAKLSSRVILLPATSTIKTTKDGFSISKQPMKTLFEQSLFILLESAVLQIMDRTKQKASDLAKRHTNLE